MLSMVNLFVRLVSDLQKSCRDSTETFQSSILGSGCTNVFTLKITGDGEKETAGYQRKARREDT